MAPKISKLPKWAIKKFGISKRAWAAARRGRSGRKAAPKARRKTAGRSTRRVSSSRGTHRSMKIGGWISKFRGMDIVSGPAQGSVMGLGLSADAGKDAFQRYSGFKDGAVDVDLLKNTYLSMATGFGHQKLRSFLRIPQGAGKGKILSIIGAVIPEVMAAGDVNPLQDFKGWNKERMKYDRAYDPEAHFWNLGSSKFQRGLLGTIALGAVSRFLAPMINKHLPKGVNL